MALDATYLVAGQVARAADVKQFYNLFTGAMTDQPVLFNNRLTLSRIAAAVPSVLNYLLITGVADTGVSAEANDVYLNLARTVQYASASAPTSSRAMRISAPTYSATAAAVITNAATLAISGPPVAGANMTLTNTDALWIESGYIRVDPTTGGIRYGAGGPVDTALGVNPEGVLALPVGSTVRSTAGPLYKKTSGGATSAGWEEVGGAVALVPDTIITTSQEMLGGQAMNTTFTAGGTGTVWPAANRMIFVPMRLGQAATIKRLFWQNGTGVSGNACISLYDASLVRLRTSGSVAQVGTSVLQFYDPADLLLATGLYYIGLSLDNAAGKIGFWTLTLNSIDGISMLRAAGCFQQASFLGTDPAVPVAIATDYAPMVGAEFIRVT